MDLTSPELVRAMSAMGLSPADVQAMMRNRGQQQPGMQTLPDNLGDVSRQLDEIRDRWAAEARMPQERPVLSARIQHEYSNKGQTQHVEEAKAGGMKAGGMKAIYQTFIGNEKNFSVTPLERLKSVNLRDMLVRKVHKGQYLLCRTFTPGLRKVAVEISIEDSNGDCILMAIYNMPGLFQASQQAVSAYFPLGTVLAIREPWMKTSGAVGTNPIIRVDSPSDVVFVSQADSLVQSVRWKPRGPLFVTYSASRWKDLGNQHFKDGFYVQAAVAWSRGLKTDPNMHVLRLNCAQAYLKLGWYSASLSESLRCIDNLSDPAQLNKAQYRAALAELALGRYISALERFRGLPDPPPDTPACIERCRKRIDEERTAEYTFLDMFNDGQKDVPRVEAADFVSAALKVGPAPTKGGGRGLFAERNLEAGELLVIAKPFASVSPAELSKTEECIGLNFMTKRTSNSVTLALTDRVISKVLGCPEQRPLIEGLYAGRKYTPLPAVYPPSVSTEGTVSVDPLRWNDIDITRIDGIVSYNTFGLRPVKPVGSDSLQGVREEDDPLKAHANAIYPFASLFNHSCDPNATYIYFGDVMVIRARRVIKGGEEITVSYSAGETYLDRDKRLSSILEQACDCPMCAQDRKAGDRVCRERARLSSVFPKGPNGETVILPPAQAKRHLQQVLATYQGPQRVPRPSLFYAYYMDMRSNENAAGKQQKIELQKHSVKRGWNALEAAGFRDIDRSFSAKAAARYTLPLSRSYLSGGGIDIDVCIFIMIHISAYFVVVRENVSAERWLRAAWWVHDCTFGGGQALFKARLGQLLQQGGTPQPQNMEYRWD